MICYGNYFKNKDTDPETGMNEINVNTVFGEGTIESFGARYTDRFLILDTDEVDSDNENTESDKESEEKD